MPTTLNFTLPSHHDPSSQLAAIKSCLTSLQLWFYTNGMALNTINPMPFFLAQLVC